MGQKLTEWDRDLAADPEDEYQALLRSLRWTEGFGLLFVECSPAEAERLIATVSADLPQKRAEVLRLDAPIDNLYRIVDQLPSKNQIDVLFITGIEKSLVEYIRPGYGGQGDYYKEDSVPRILGHLNLQRERFRDDFSHICFVFLLPKFALKYFIRRAPDFFDWRSGVFEFPTDAELLSQESDRIVAEGDYQKYLSLPSWERRQKILEIQSLIEEDYQTLEHQTKLFFEQGNLFAASDEHQEAIASYDKAIELKPDDHEAWYNRGNALGLLGRYEEAIASFDKAIELKPDDHEAWYNRGNALKMKNLGRYEEAIASFDKAIKLKPDYHEAWYGRGNALGLLGRYEEAIASFDKAIKLKPDYHEAWYNRGNALGLLGRYEEAIASYDKAIDLKPDKHDAWYGRGNALYDLGQYEEAIASCDKAIELKPDYHYAWYNRACNYALQSNVEQALENLQKAIDLNPDQVRKWAKTDSAFDSIRDDERFQALMQEG